MKDSPSDLVYRAMTKQGWAPQPSPVLNQPSQATIQPSQPPSRTMSQQSSMRHSVSTGVLTAKSNGSSAQRPWGSSRGPRVPMFRPHSAPIHRPLAYVPTTALERRQLQNEEARASRRSLTRSTSTLCPFGVVPIGPTGMPAPSMHAPPQPSPGATHGRPHGPPAATQRHPTWGDMVQAAAERETAAWNNDDTVRRHDPAVSMTPSAPPHAPPAIPMPTWQGGGQANGKAEQFCAEDTASSASEQLERSSNQSRSRLMGAVKPWPPAALHTTVTPNGAPRYPAPPR